MFGALLTLGILSAAVPAGASSVESERVRLERRVQRWMTRTDSAEGRWEDACSIIEDEPEDPKLARSHLRAEIRLVNRRARLVSLQRRLEALGAPASEVRVFYSTNREPWRRDRRWYRARDSGTLEYGTALVRIPEDHPTGALERGLEILEVSALEPEVWEQQLRHTLDTLDAGILTYVHGYNNSFSYAVRRSAQLAHDLEPAVVPVLYSWPAHGGTWLASAKYTFDENEAARSSAGLAETLTRLGALDVSVSAYAHSMGSRVLSNALLDLRQLDGSLPSLDQIVYAAPDIDAALFTRRYLGLAVAASDQVTVYCAQDDRALKLSRGVHGGYDRLGTCRPGTLGALHEGGVEVVDASRLYVNMLDHDKVSNSPRLIRDLGLLLTGIPTRDPRRGLVDRGGWCELPP